jgi:hypothetical protein
MLCLVTERQTSRACSGRMHTQCGGSRRRRRRAARWTGNKLFFVCGAVAICICEREIAITPFSLQTKFAVTINHHGCACGTPHLVHVRVQHMCAVANDAPTERVVLMCPLKIRSTLYATTLCAAAAQLLRSNVFINEDFCV